ncbi:MAG TPA: Rieske 2Fe-2S domain-containing protein [Alphaproteobacteria bacterium]|nr:Rieske 2Fe-2S domain-containing protein [Alphaproteobacteria bacterium]
MTSTDPDFAHIGPGTLAGRYMRRFWHPILRSSGLVVGRPVRVHVLGEYFTAYRGENGVARLLEDRCPHRQTSLFLGWVAGDNIRCFYHGWEFDGSGQCVRQPAEKDNFAAKVCIRSYPVREYLGLIFAYLGEGEPPEFRRFPELEDTDCDTAVHSHPVPCNFFQRVENDLDELHVHFVHSVTASTIGLDEMPEVKVSETDYGIRREGHRTGKGTNLTRIGHFMMPNISMVDLPPSPSHPFWTVTVSWRVPNDDENMTTFAIRLQHRETGKAGGERPRHERKLDPDPIKLTEDILAGKLRVQDLDPAYPGLFMVQDNLALAGQGRIVDRSRDRLGQSDRGVILLRKLWARELRALENGEPLKEWRRPATRLDLAVTTVGALVEF